MDSPEPPSPSRLERLPLTAQWAALVAFSLALTIALEMMQLPAALLIGPMLAGIVAGINGTRVRVPRLAFAASQSALGCLIAMSISLEILGAFGRDWPLFAGTVIATLLASSFLGWLISRWKILPGSTAVWGSAPGGATAMVVMAGAFGADQRLVAFMQYLRVIMVSVAAAVIAGLWVDTSGAEAPPQVWFPTMEWMAFACTLAIALVGCLLGRLLRLPSPYFFGVVLFAVAIHLGGVPMQVPPWLLAIAYPMIGWSVGLNFTRTILRHALRALPQVIGSILALMAFCGGLAWLLTHQLGVDPLTAYLATSPGGLDSVAVIAAAADDVDLSFVMAMQGARMLVVLAIGPMLARFVARLVRD